MLSVTIMFQLRLFAESRIGRQPNAVKHATFLELSRIKSANGITSPLDPFLLSETKLDLTEIGDNDSIVAIANDLPDFTVTTSHDCRRLTVGRKTPRQPYRRRSEKVTTEISDSSDPPCLSPVEIKQEIASSVECDTNEPVGELEVELVQESPNCGQQRLTEKHLEHVNQPTGMHTRNIDSAADSVQCGISEQLPTDNFEAAAAGLAVPRSGPSLTIPKFDPVNTSVSVAASSETPQPNYEDIVTSMQRACYDLLPILDRV